MHDSRFPLAVLIPTYNRVDTLLQCLDHLERQTCRDFEVVIVDDGSTDETWPALQSYAHRTSLHMRFVRQENVGPARARNHAVSLADSPICLMIGDDIFAAPQLIEEHLNLHRSHNSSKVAGLGLTRWCETGQTVTAFMRWIDQEGMQFHYGELLRGVKPNWRHFYTSNLSVKTDMLKKFPFDESFPHAAMEDIDLGYRLEKEQGLEMVFLREAVAYHLHPTSYLQQCRRMVKVGESVAYFNSKWPNVIEQKSSIRTRVLHAAILSTPFALEGLARLGNWSIGMACPNRLMNFVLRCYLAKGRAHYLHKS